ncbi:hypothetical protein C5167_034477 [Papaver somniferum]|uniref:Transmembrane protein n=1 Tax=Papaver somniferum TaxID=3469 RepID=A0A4Y7KHB8_PAPSO|nr:hypothetical protein C5167_034477 [Papaver somniferum]
MDYTDWIVALQYWWRCERILEGGLVVVVCGGAVVYLTSRFSRLVVKVDAGDMKVVVDAGDVNGVGGDDWRGAESSSLVVMQNRRERGYWIVQRAKAR